jgi:hypothetical protein
MAESPMSAPSPSRTSRDVRFRAAIGGIADVEVLRLTLLAPDIIEMILDGRQPPGLQFEQLRKSFPLEWQAQRNAIDAGIAESASAR